LAAPHFKKKNLGIPWRLLQHSIVFGSLRRDEMVDPPREGVAFARLTHIEAYN
jgi:hypothetical protein